MDGSFHEVDKQFIDLSPDPYPHWMIKEIYEQISASSRAINNGGRLSGEIGIKLGGLDAHKDILLKYKKICFLGCGTSLHAGMYGSVYFNRFGIQTRVCDASEFYDYNFDSEDLYIVLSQSGETKDVHRAMELIQKQNGVIVSVVNVVESLIAREALCGVYINAGNEKSVASTKSFTNQVIVLCLVAIWFYKNEGVYTAKKDELFERLRSDLLELSDAIKTTIDSCIEPVRKIADILYKKENMFLLGRGSLYPIGLEGALKIKEISYIHAEAYPAGEFKHGPLALVDKEMPVVAIAPNDALLEKLKSNMQEVRARGGQLYVLADQDARLVSSEGVEVITLTDHAGILSPILHTVPLPLLAYHAALARGNDVDKPRNLAKSVTVE